MEGQNKPPQVIDKIVEGKLNSFYEQVCLLDQPSIRDPEGHDRPARAGRDREDGREHLGPALRALQAGRNGA